MPNEEWGTKRVCTTTGKRFYDLNKDPIVSPYSGEVISPDSGKSNRTMVADKADKASEAKAAAEETETVLDDDTSDVDLGDDVLDDEDEGDTVPLDEITDVAANDDDD